MSITHPSGASRRANRIALTATLVFSIGALAVLGLLSALDGGSYRTAPGFVYAVSLIACSLCSFLYNMLETARSRNLLRLLDHAAIFLLIGGTYTPFAAAGLAGPFGISLLIWVWSLCAIGIALKLILGAGYHRLFVWVYLAIGWIGLFASGQFVQLIPLPAIAFLGIGGLAYTVGALIYARDIGTWTEPVWHVLVLTGALAHFTAVVMQLGTGNA